MKIKDLPYKRADFDQTKKILVDIIEKIKKTESAEQLIALRREFVQASDEFSSMASLAFIRFTQNTKDEFYLEEKKFYDEKFPLLSEVFNNFITEFLASPHVEEAKKVLPAKLFTMYDYALKSNNPIVIAERQKEAEIVTEYSELMGGMEFEFQGKKMPLSMLRGYLMDADRQVRKEATIAIGKGLEAHASELDDIFDRLVKIRHEIAVKSGYKNYAEISVFERGRYDYDTETLNGFKAGVKKYLVPLVNRLKSQTAKELGIDKISFYDSTVTLKGGEARPSGDKQQILASALEVYREMNPELGDFMKTMQDNDAFDVDARDAKFGGGYCSEINKFKKVFILANFNGSSDDIDVMTHEFGHAVAMNYVYTYGDTELGVGGMETAECHSMSMEFLAWKYIDKFFGKDSVRYRYKHLYDALAFIPYGVIIDEFQKQVYEHPEMTPSQRNELYMNLEKEYRPYLDYEGLPYLDKGTRWQYQMHVYESPFYYIDYCLAQTVALEFLMASLENYDHALNSYLEFCKKGGTQYFRKLVEEADLESPFDADSFAKICEKAEQVLAQLKKEI